MKLEINEFINVLNKYDVLFISETWANEMNELGIEGYSKPICKFRKRKKSGKRDSGGLCVYFRNEIISGVEEIKWNFEDGLSFKLKASFFGWKEDSYLFCIYMRSNQSTRENINEGLNCYDELLEKLTIVPENADVFVVGDFNARVSDKLEIRESDNFNQIDSIFELINVRGHSVILEEDFINNHMSVQRTNQDTSINEYGHKLINLCKTADLCIINGRSFEDKGKGKLTFCNKNGKSTIDYVLASKYALYKLCNFDILPFNVFSDHSFITFDIKINTVIDNVAREPTVTKNEPKVFTKWNPDFKNDYCSNLNEDETVAYMNVLSETCASVESTKGVEECIEKFTDILLKNGAKHTKEVNFNGNYNKTVRSDINESREGWYDKECYEQSRIFKEYETIYWETGLEEDRVAMCQQRNVYRRMCRDKKISFNQSEATNILKLSKTNSKEFWKKIKGKDNREKGNNCDFFQHFKDLANMDSRVGEEGLREVEGSDFDDKFNESEILDTPIDLNELNTCIKKLKNDKAAGPDNIVNEFLCNASPAVKLFLLILFNKIIELEYFPSSWAVGRVVPVFKKGDKNNVNNYRGLTIISCLAKLFTKIMNDRLTLWVDSQQLLTDAQYGFRKNRSTVDCLFIIQGLIDIIFAKGLKLYVCFIDYEKAYDLIDRACLFHKLLKLNVSSKCINIFKDMYKKMKLTLHDDAENRYFSSNVGLLQGESTSPLLFSLFVNDLENSLPDEKVGINVVNILIKLLMFADDMAIFSTTIEGLQAGIDNLSKYCSKWGLTVNIIKTKIVIFRRGGKVGEKEKWWFNGSLLEVVPAFKYLGCILSSSGSYTNCITDLISSARRALFCLKKFINKNPEVLPKMQLELFSLKVSPILNYGSEVWGLRKADAIEVFHLSFLKNLLGVKSSTPNCFVYGELGVLPMIVERKIRVLKFWLKIIRSLNSNENYVQKVYKELINVNHEYPSSVTWVSQVKNMLETCGMGFAWRNQFVFNEDQFLSIFKQRVIDMYLQEWRYQVDMTSNNRLFKNLKNEFYYESYLSLNNRALRIAITKIRLSSHALLIERGRWGPNKLEVEDRKCSICQNEVEDEFHCLLKCPRFNNQRIGLLADYLKNEPSRENFNIFLNTKNLNDQKKLGLLCFKILKEYREMM